MRERTRLTIVWCAGNGLLVKVGGRVEIGQRSMAGPRARRGVPPRAAQRRAREGRVVRWGRKRARWFMLLSFRRRGGAGCRR